MPAHAQNVNPDDRLKSFAALPKADAEYRLGAGDLIEIGVFGVDEFRHTMRINSSGVIKLPLVEAITAAGLTPAELEQRLTSLLEADVIKNPQVSVFVKEDRSQPVYVLGAVRNPGQYQITLQMRIVDAISMAGGVTPVAGDAAVIQRTSRDGGEQMINVNLKEILEKGDLARNVIVQGGDVIHIKDRVIETVYVIGEVNRSGAFVKPPNQELRVSQVIAWAGGPAKTAKLSKGILVRYNESGAARGTAGGLWTNPQGQERGCPGPWQRHHLLAGEPSEGSRYGAVERRERHARGRAIHDSVTGLQIVAADFFVVPTATCRRVFVLVLLGYDRRHIRHIAVTAHPELLRQRSVIRGIVPLSPSTAAVDLCCGHSRAALAIASRNEPPIGRLAHFLLA